MQSIFIWKSHMPNNSNEYINYYSGSNWVLESSNNTESNSYIFIGQNMLNIDANKHELVEEFGNRVVIFDIKMMPINWVGSDYFEGVKLPYRKIKTDLYGTLDQIGEWMRFRKTQYTYNTSIQQDILRIYNWIHTE